MEISRQIGKEKRVGLLDREWTTGNGGTRPRFHPGVPATSRRCFLRAVPMIRRGTTRARHSGAPRYFTPGPVGNPPASGVPFELCEHASALARANSQGAKGMATRAGIRVRRAGQGKGGGAVSEFFPGTQGTFERSFFRLATGDSDDGTDHSMDRSARQAVFIRRVTHRDRGGWGSAFFLAPNINPRADGLCPVLTPKSRGHAAAGRNK